MSDFYKGCGTYMRILSELGSAKTFTAMQIHACAARAHREGCPECQSLNTAPKPLTEQLFGCKVVVLQEET